MTYPVLIYKILYYFRFINKDGSNNNFQHIILRLRSYCLCSETSNCQNLTQKEETVELRDYMPNIWGNAGIAIMGAGQGVWPKLFFLVHMTMSTGPLASPPPRGRVS